MEEITEKKKKYGPHASQSRIIRKNITLRDLKIQADKSQRKEKILKMATEDRHITLPTEQIRVPVPHQKLETRVPGMYIF